VLTLPALATDVRHPDDPRQPGEALWPWFRSAAELERMRLLEPRDFYALEQQDPRAEGGTEWGPECFPADIWFDDWPREIPLTLVIALDPSKGANAKSGDPAAFVAVARDRDGGLWCEADLVHMNPTALVGHGLEFIRRVEGDSGRPVEGFGCEADQFQEMLADEIRKALRAADMSTPLYKLTTGNVDKKVRIRRLSAEIAGRKVRFRNTPGTRLLVRQLQEFPTGDHDDGPDAMEYARRLLFHLLKGKRK
jgi:predicted phage terminase large subunit-like protein